MVNDTTVLCNQEGAIMDRPIEPSGRRRRCALRLTSGLDVLDAWSQHASPAELNVVARVLFAVTERSVFTTHQVVDDVARTMEFFVLARRDLTVKIRVHGLDSFGIVYIGPTCSAPGLDQAEPEIGSSLP
jgi:Family of unknown function (DUF6235)